MKRTPTTDEGLRQYDHLPAAEAVVLAWAVPGSNPSYHELARAKVEAAMPLLARALYRLEAEAR